MREILFRGKRLDNGEWVEATSILSARDGDMPEFYIAAKGGMDLCADADCNVHGIVPTGRVAFYQVDPNTVGQYTGLTDKNGRKVFEGDILSTENGTFENTGMGHILLYKGMWTCFYGQDAIGRDCFDTLCMVCNSREIIGNIHDDPELLNQ